MANEQTSKFLMCVHAFIHSFIDVKKEKTLKLPPANRTMHAEHTTDTMKREERKCEKKIKDNS